MQRYSTHDKWNEKDDLHAINEFQMRKIKPLKIWGITVAYEGTLTLFRRFMHSYSYLSNKRSPTIILLFLKKIIEKLGENRKDRLFSKASFYNVTKIPGPSLVPDPSFIRFRYFFQTLRLFATLRF